MLTVRMVDEPGDLPMGWGTHIIEGPNKAAMAWTFIVLTSFCCFAAFSWAIWKKDLATGMGLGQFLTAVVTLVASLVVSQYFLQIDR